jgi:hypothetical protein
LRNDCIAEESHAGEYADYTFLAPRRILVVEAKHEGNYFELPAGINRIEYSIPSLIMDPNLAKALDQVAEYCQKRGIIFGAVAHGHQMVAFIATHQDSSPLEGRALVFPSINFMLMNFQELWNALSKPEIQDRSLESRLIGQAKSLYPPTIVFRFKLSGCKGTPSVPNRSKNRKRVGL